MTASTLSLNTILCLATPHKRLLTVLGLREKPLEASARLREAANPPVGCQCWINWRHPHMAVLTALFDFDCSASGIISTFLHVHPFGASIEYICSYLQRLDTKVTGPRDSKCRVLAEQGWVCHTVGVLSRKKDKFFICALWKILFRYLQSIIFVWIIRNYLIFD